MVELAGRPVTERTPGPVLSDDERARFDRNGWLSVPGLVERAWLDRLRDITEEFVDASRTLTESNMLYDLDAGHSADDPRLRRLSSPTDLHDGYWEFAADSVITDVAVDLLGPDVKFHHSKLNFKWANGGEEVKWHYDISFYPHTNYSPLTVGTYLYDCGMEQGPLACLPASHQIEPMLSQYNAEGSWTGCLSDADVAKLDLSKMKYLPGPAGSLTIHNCRTLHYSAKNDSDLGRPLLLNAMSSADAFPYTVNPIKPKHDQYILRGKRAQFAHHDPRPCLMPPDWSKGYTSIFALQQEEAVELER